MKYCVDIDGTLLYTDSEYRVDAENTKLIRKINELHSSGHTITIQTGRHWDKLLMTIEQLKLCGLKYHTLTMGKPTADVYIDDRSVRPDEFI